MKLFFNEVNEKGSDLPLLKTLSEVVASAGSSNLIASIILVLNLCAFSATDFSPSLFSKASLDVVIGAPIA